MDRKVTTKVAKVGLGSRPCVRLDGRGQCKSPGYRRHGRRGEGGRVCIGWECASPLENEKTLKGKGERAEVKRVCLCVLERILQRIRHKA